MTSPIGAARKENSAEHSWQVILMAITLEEHANTGVDLLRVVKMLAIHDVVEIDVGDTFHYAKSSTPDLAERELAAAKRVLGMLPDDQAAELLQFWREFEARETPEAQFAAAIDRLVAFLLNAGNRGGTWIEHEITTDQVLEKNGHIAEGSEALWAVARQIAQEFAYDGAQRNAETQR